MITLCYADPYVKVHFLHHTSQTHTISSSLTPTWDETVLIDNIFIHGHPTSHMITEPLKLLLQLYDEDKQVCQLVIHALRKRQPLP